MENFKSLVVPIAVIISLTVGNYLRLTEMEIQTLQEAVMAVGTGVIAIAGVYSVARRKNKQDPPKE